MYGPVIISELHPLLDSSSGLVPMALPYSVRTGNRQHQYDNCRNQHRKGLFITPLAIFDQKPSSPASTRKNGTLNEFTLSPRTDSWKNDGRGQSQCRSANSSPPKEGRPVFSKKSIPISPTMTVIPEENSSTSRGTSHCYSGSMVLLLSPSESVNYEERVINAQPDS